MPCSRGYRGGPLIDMPTEQKTFCSCSSPGNASATDRIASGLVQTNEDPSPVPDSCCSGRWHAKSCASTVMSGV